MALIKCPECGKEISDKAKNCPHCGYPLIKENMETYSSSNKYSFNGYSYVGNEDSYNQNKSNMKYSLNENQSFYKKNKNNKKKLIIILSIILFLSLVGGCTAFTAMMAAMQESEPSSEKEISDTKKENEDVISEDIVDATNTSENEEIKNDDGENTSTQIPKQEIDVDSLTEDEYMANCTELWHDDIFFSEENLEGQYVKLDLFVEESYYFKVDALYNSIASDFIKEFDLKRDYYKCGVQRKDSFSYMGGQINLYFSNAFEYSASDMKEGDHLIVYGKIIDYSTNTIDGYNSCSILPRLIENSGQ